MAEIILFFSLLIIGFLINKFFKPKKTEYLIKIFIVYFGCPILILYSVLNHERVQMSRVFLIVALSVVINLILAKFGNDVFKLKDKGAFLLLNSFSNAGFLGLPFCWLLFQEQGLYYGSLYVLVQSAAHFTLGIAVALRSELQGIGKSARAIGKFPAFWTSLCVILILLSGINISGEAMKIFGYLGKATLILSGLYIGLNLKFPRNFGFFLKECLYAGIFRFLISPLVVLALSFFLKTDGFRVLTLQAMMPPAILNTVIAGYYNFNKELCASITAILTVIFLLIFAVGFFIVGV